MKKTFLDKLGDAHDALDRIEKLYRLAYDVGSDDDRCRSRDALDDLYYEAGDLADQAKDILSDAEDLI